MKDCWALKTKKGDDKESKGGCGKGKGGVRGRATGATATGQKSSNCRKRENVDTTHEAIVE